MFKNLQDWMIGWADSPSCGWALFGLAFAESSFFPVPPDLLLIALGIARPEKALLYALLCSVGSVMGGIAGFYIGRFFMDSLGRRILEFYGVTDKFNIIGDRFKKFDAIAIGIAGFTPIPYKVFTIAAGAFGINLLRFVLVSIISRSARFFLVGVLLMIFGAPIQQFLESYFNIISIIFVVVLILGFILVKKFSRVGA